MQFVHWPHEAAPPVPAVDWLEIHRGRTQFPQRPLTVDRFLIGSGSNCHLQLGGGLPMLHSLLVREGDAWALEAIAPEPWIFINDHPIRREVLAVGDTIKLIEFEFVLRRSDGDGGDERSQRGRRHPRTVRAADVTPATGGMSTLQLVDCIEQEFDLIETLEPTPISGATALLRAIRRYGETGPRSVLSKSQDETSVDRPNPPTPGENTRRAA